MFVRENRTCKYYQLKITSLDSKISRFLVEDCDVGGVDRDDRGLGGSKSIYRFSKYHEIFSNIFNSIVKEDMYLSLSKNTTLTLLFLILLKAAVHACAKFGANLILRLPYNRQDTDRVL